MTLKRENGGYTMTFGPEDMVGEQRSGEDWQQRAEALPEESDRNDNTADPYPSATATPAADTTGDDTDQPAGNKRDGWTPRAPILSVFSALMLRISTTTRAIAFSREHH